MKEKFSILVHGYTKNKNDMRVLARNLERLGHTCFLVDLPLMFHDIKYASSVLEENVKSILKEIGKDKKINFIGHSAGGLVIRDFLERTKYSQHINKCVLIATPNNGSDLADMATKYLKVSSNIFKMLQYIKTDYVKNMREINYKKIKVGAIAGNKNNLLLGVLLKEENDGRVKVKSVFQDSLDDFIILPYGHEEIHYKEDTAKLVDNFIMRGKFR